MNTLADLIHESGLSYQEIADRSGGTVSKQNVGQYARKPLKEFPTPPKLQGLARALGISQREVVLAAATSVKMYVGRDADETRLGHLLAGHAHWLTLQQQEAIAYLVRSFTEPNEDLASVPRVKKTAERIQEEEKRSADVQAAREQLIEQEIDRRWAALQQGSPSTKELLERAQDEAAEAPDAPGPGLDT